MKQYIIRVHPSIKHEEGMIIVNAPSLDRAKEILSTITNRDMFPDSDEHGLATEPFFNKFQPMNIQEKLNKDTVPDECWYVLKATPTNGKEGFIAGTYHVG